MRTGMASSLDNNLSVPSFSLHTSFYHIHFINHAVSIRRGTYMLTCFLFTFGVIIGPFGSVFCRMLESMTATYRQHK